jgi:hypothetical protein
MADEQTTIPLIHTKLNRPPVTKGHLHRERLLDWLEKNRQHPLSLVSASAGYGKSTLLSCWLDLLHLDHIETNLSHEPPEPHLWNFGNQGVALRNVAPPLTN